MCITNGIVFNIALYRGCIKFLFDFQTYIYISCFYLLDPVEIHQTVPVNRTVCPGEKLQYTCISSLTSIAWEINSSASIVFDLNNYNVTSNETIGGFFISRTVQNATISIFTATNDMVTSSYSGVKVTCVGGSSASSIDIDVAGTVFCNS